MNCILLLVVLHTEKVNPASPTCVRWQLGSLSRYPVFVGCKRRVGRTTQSPPSSLGPCRWQQNIWLGSGRDFWESHGIFGRADGTQAVHFWPRREKILLQCVCPCVCVVLGRKDILREVTQNNDRFTAPHPADRRAHGWLMSSRDLWALQQIPRRRDGLHNESGGNLYPQGDASTVSVHCIYLIQSKRKRKLMRNHLSSCVLEQPALQIFCWWVTCRVVSVTSSEYLITKLTDVFRVIAQRAGDKFIQTNCINKWVSGCGVKSWNGRQYFKDLLRDLHIVTIKPALCKMSKIHNTTFRFNIHIPVYKLESKVWLWLTSLRPFHHYVWRHSGVILINIRIFVFM